LDPLMEQTFRECVVEARQRDRIYRALHQGTEYQWAG
jgi:hypothetical protein